MARDWILSLCFLYIVLMQQTSANKEEELVQHILKSYKEAQRYTIPVKSVNDTIKVNLGIYLVRIKHLDTNTGDAKFLTWWKLNWTDNHLGWDPAKYGGIKVVRVPVTKLWRPDLVLYNSEDVSLHQSLGELAIVYSHGVVLWIPWTEMHATCSRVKWSWKCHFKVGSWTYDGYRLDMGFLAEHKVVTSDWSTVNRRWIITHNSAQRVVQYYACCEEPYVHLSFDFVVKQSQNNNWLEKLNVFT